MFTDVVKRSMGCIAVVLAVLTLISGLASTAVAATLPGVSVQPVLWLDAGAGVTELGGLVSNWADQSTGGAGGHDAVQATGARQPTLVANAVNGQPAIRFDPSATSGNFDAMEIPDHDDLDIGNGAGVGATLFVVFDGVDWTQRFLLDKRAVSGNDDWAVWSISDNLRWRNGNDANHQLDVSAPSLDAFHLLTCDLDQPILNTGTKNVWLDGAFMGTQSYSSPNVANTGPLNIAKHGSLPDDFTYLGDIAEIILFDSQLSAADRHTVEEYLNAKYGVDIGLMPGVSVQPVLWLDAGAGVTTNVSGNVSTWLDQSRGGAGSHNAVQANGARQPTLVPNAVNGHPAIRFDPSATSGNFDAMEIPDHDDLDIGNGAGVGATLFVVFDGVDWTQRFLLDKRAVSGSDDWGVWSLPDGDGVLRWRNGNDPDHQLDVPAPSLDAFHLLTCDLDQPTPGSGSKRVWVDSVPAGSNTYAFPNATNSGPLNIGKHASLPDDYTYLGDMAEIIFFDSQLSIGDVNTVTYYLQWKYFGMTIPSRGTVVVID